MMDAGKDALILDIQRMSTEDGPGLRTTVFFKGCNLACPWCHNPESIRTIPDLNWFGHKCIGCGICETACKHGAVSRNAGLVKFNRTQCKACGGCAEECPNGAIELKGKFIPVETLCRELAKDRSYFGAEGGVTLSGGEVMLQAETAMALVRLLHEVGIGVALDTAGCYDFRVLEAVLPYTDLVLYDLKIFDPAEHKRIIGVDNRLILENYRRLIKTRARVWVRTPVIEEATGSPENIRALGAFIREAGVPEKWELCSFNNLCRDKYERLDLDWQYKNAGLTRKEHIENLRNIAAEFVPCAVYSGTTV
jgi:pyruvate formate lyase activating enzyme